MRTSRISQDAAKVAQLLSPSRRSTAGGGRQTRSSLLLPGSAATSPAGKNAPKAESPVPNGGIGGADEDSSALSSAESDALLPVDSPPTPSTGQKRKRKHGANTETPGTSVSTTRRGHGATRNRSEGERKPAAVTVRARETRVSPRKKKTSNGHAIKAEDDNGDKEEEEAEKEKEGGEGDRIDTALEIDIEDVVVNRSTKKARRQPAKRIVDPATGLTKMQPPANWEEMYALTQEMRRRNPAPVDTMGCESAMEQDVPPREKRFQTLISLMLSSQTKDTVNAMTMARLRRELPAPGLTLENILAVSPARLNELIYGVGFHNNKTRFIKAAAEILRDQHAGDIPDSVEGLVALPGVGPKMAYLCMSAAWGRTEGIGVDVHVHRITNLWGWHAGSGSGSGGTHSPEETRAALEAWLPRDRWHDINHLLVGFGQTICTPVARRCGECTLARRGLCPSAVVRKKTEVRKKTKKKNGNGNENGNEAKKEEEKEEELVVREEELLAEDIG